MSKVSSVSSSDSKYIDDLLSLRKWSGDAVSFGFSQTGALYGAGYGRGEAQSFRPLTAGQQQAANDAMKMWGELIGLDIVRAAADEADIRLATSSLPSTAWAYTPSATAQGGDVWLGTTYLASPTKGNYAYLTILHEIGHALGLRHPHEAGTLQSGSAPDDGLCPCCAGILHGQGAVGDTNAHAATPPSPVDAMAWSIMSYRSYEGQSVSMGYTNETFGYAQTPMARDIAAMQHLYGANYETRADDTVYRWSETTGEKFVNDVGQGRPGGNKIFETIWDGGGRDTFDFSNYASNLEIDLAPGGWINLGNSQRAHLGNGDVAPGNIALALLHEDNPLALIENAIGGSGDDIITGNSAGNVLIGNGGNDIITGGAGRNILVGDGLGDELGLIGFSARDFIPGDLPSQPLRAGNDILIGGDHNDIFIPGFGRNEVRGGEGIDIIVLDLALGALTLTLDPGGLLTIVHDGGSVEASGVEILALRDGIYSLVGPVGEANMPQSMNEITLLYRAGLGRAPDAPGLDYWLAALADGADMDGIALSLIDSPEFADRFGTPATLADAEFITALYRNVLGREGDGEGMTYWQGQMSAGASRSELLLSFAYSEENRANVPAVDEDGVGLVAMTLTQWSEIWG